MVHKSCSRTASAPRRRPSFFSSGACSAWRPTCRAGAPTRWAPGRARTCTTAGSQAPPPQSRRAPARAKQP
eukprot:694691-Pleurochrysis_carterae.AAC.1